VGSKWGSSLPGDQKQVNNGIVGAVSPAACHFQADLAPINNFQGHCFIANKSKDAWIFGEKDVSRALWKLGYMVKVTFTVLAYQAFMEQNLNCCCFFWT
jgi:hypothetical protein